METEAEEISRRKLRTEAPQLFRVASGEQWQIDAAVWCNSDIAGFDDAAVELILRLRGLFSAPEIRQVNLRFQKR